MNMERYIAMAAVAMMFAACSNDDMPISGVDAMTDKPLMVNADVAELSTRSGMSTVDLETLGLSISNPVNSLYSYANVKYTHNGSAFTPEGDVQPLWQNGTQEIIVSAWSPYIDADITNGYGFCVQADQRSEEAAKASDFLWVRETVDPDGVQTDKKITYNEGALNIAMQHAMSKLVVNINLGTELEQVTVTNVVVKKLENACQLDLTAGIMQAPAVSVKKDIQAYKETTANAGYALTYEAIFPPQKAPFDIMVELSDGRKFLHENAEFDFQSDWAYTLNLKVGKEKVEAASIAARSWVEISDCKNIETE